MMPSVTRILSPWQDFSKVPPEVLANAADRGSRVHGLCAAYAQGLYIPKVDDDCQGFFQSFCRWFDATVDAVLFCEEELRDEEIHFFRGHPDLGIIIKGDQGNTLTDLKTPIACAASWRVQLSAYKYLAEINGYPIQRVFPLRLSRDGKAPIINEYSGTANKDFHIFLNCLSAWRYFNGH